MRENKIKIVNKYQKIREGQISPGISPEVPENSK